MIKQAEIELAKSWFVLAQICAMITGFMILSLSIILPLTLQLFEFPFELINNLEGINEVKPNIASENLTKMFDEVVNGVGFITIRLINLAKYMIGFATFFLILSLIFWSVGHFKLNNIKNKF